MTLIYDKNSKMDNRKVEYEQSIVRLGLEKAATQREADRARQEIKDLGARKIQVMKDIKNLEDDLVADRKKLQEVGLEVFEMIKNAEANVSKIREKEKEVVNSTGNKKFELKKLEEYLASLTEQIHERNKKRFDYQRKAKMARDALTLVNSELTAAKQSVEKVSDDVKSVYQIKLKVTNEVIALKTEKEELEDIVSVLKTNNKEGLGLVASFEGERKRLQEKDDFLRRKEADLVIYENRLQKRMQEAGFKTEMVFK